MSNVRRPKHTVQEYLALQKDPAAMQAAAETTRRLFSAVQHHDLECPCEHCVEYSEAANILYADVTEELNG